MCIVFLASHGDRVLVGNNEDYVYPKNRVWYVPSACGNVEGSVFESGRFPRVYYGYDGFPPQSGMNEAGLCFAITSASPREIAGAAGKAEYEGYLVDKVMAECATVEEALGLISPYVIEELERACLFFGDKTGDSTIVEGNAILRKEGRHQVLSNFRQSQAAPGAHLCDRYDIAVEMLNESSDISVERFRRILAATHQEDNSKTLYSNIFDLTRGVVHQYYFHNFTHEIVSDPREQWAKGPCTADLATLFPRTYAAIVYQRTFEFERNQDKIIEERRASGEIVEIDPDILDRYVGRYLLEMQGTKVVDVFRMGDRLLARVTGRETQELFPLSATCFVSIQVGGDHLFTFAEDDKGLVVRLVVNAGNGWVLSAPKTS